MSDKLSCHIVKDLLPLYADGLTGSETSEDIKAHLEGCEDCSKALRAMTEGEPEPSEQADTKKTKEIDYLKKVKKRSRIPAVIVGCIALLIIAGVMLRFFVIGDSAGKYFNNMNMFVQARVSGNMVEIEVFTANSGTAVSKISCSEKDGLVTVDVRTVPVLFFKEGDAKKTHYASSKVYKVVGPGGCVLWENGIGIDNYVQRIFMAKTPYVGNNSAVGNLLQTVELGNGPSHAYFELQTASEPYGLKVYNVTVTEAGREHQWICKDYELPYVERNYMSQACKLLACIDNLGYFEYYAKPDNLDVVFQGKITAEDAFEYVKSLAGNSEFTYSSIKDFGKSAASLQQLDNILNHQAITR